MSQRHYPIVFSIGDNPIPIALMGLNEGVNVFLDDDGRADRSEHLHPGLSSAAIRSCWPGCARTATNCRCASTRPPDAVGDFEEGEALFDGDQPSEATKAILEFCEQFEAAGQRTAAFMEDLKKTDLLMDGEVAIQPEGYEQPFVYRGFRMVDEEKLRELRGDELRKMNQNGMLPLIYAHLFSLSADARRVRPADAAGQGAAPRSRSRPRRRLRTYSAAVANWRPSRASPSSTASASIKLATRSKPGPGSPAPGRDSNGGRSRSAARARRAPDARGGR